ncbi:hypothetical protein NDU88_002071 [Pleurodeles waltl]|uniref:Uncharacterized protein n=1 Tax=Pleurodeles waltl TaxID=8319 RepID=A0AAV7TKS4_PLEWA|nr:hypothetical protein NDU88_002071 [Pleurodeles waltl]
MKAERYEHVLDPRSGERPVCSRQSLVSTDGTCETTYPRTKQDSQRATSLFPLSPTTGSLASERAHLVTGGREASDPSRGVRKPSQGEE